MNQFRVRYRTSRTAPWQLTAPLPLAQAKRYADHLRTLPGMEVEMVESHRDGMRASS